MTASFFLFASPASASRDRCQPVNKAINESISRFDPFRSKEPGFNWKRLSNSTRILVAKRASSLSVEWREQRQYVQYVQCSAQWSYVPLQRCSVKRACFRISVSTLGYAVFLYRSINMPEPEPEPKLPECPRVSKMQGL